MIGIRPLLSAGTVTLAIIAGLGPGAPRPEVEVGARRLVAERADRYEQALAALGAELAAAVEEARAGAARMVAGARPPDPALNRAAVLTARAEQRAARARAALAELQAAHRAWRPDEEPPDAPLERGELDSIAAQLTASAEAADEFVAMRERATTLTNLLRDALAALDAGDLAGARPLVAHARADHDAVAAWEVDLVSLPVWLETTDEMIGAVERIVSATERSDAGAAAAAAAEFAALAGEAAQADRALRIAIGEGGSAVTAAPLGRLASALSSIEEQRAALRPLREAARQ